MSEARLEILRAGYDACNRDDYEAWIAAYGEDVAAETVGTTNAFFRASACQTDVAPSIRSQHPVPNAMAAMTAFA